MNYAILVHEAEDDVGVAVRDLTAGEEVGVATLEGQPLEPVKMVEDTPLGHKVALRALEQGKHVIEYGRAIGRATQDVPAGGHVHVHNLTSLRWERSVVEKA